MVSIDNAVFNYGVYLQGDNVSVYATKKPQDLAVIVSTHISKGVEVRDVSVAGHWVIVQTNNPKTVPVDGVDSY